MLILDCDDFKVLISSDIVSFVLEYSFIFSSFWLISTYDFPFNIYPLFNINSLISWNWILVIPLFFAAISSKFSNILVIYLSDDFLEWDFNILKNLSPVISLANSPKKNQHHLPQFQLVLLFRKIVIWHIRHNLYSTW